MSRAQIGRRVILIGAASSIHTQTWKREFELRGLTVDMYSGDSASVAISSIGRSWRHRHRRAAFTVVHSLGRHALLALFVRKGGRLIVVPWGSEVVAARRRGPRQQLAGLLLRQADLILTTSVSMAHCVQNWWALMSHQVRTLSWGVDADFFDSPRSSARSSEVRARLGYTESDVLVISPRGRTAVYRHDEICNAVASAQSFRPEIKLITVGADSGSSFDAAPIGMDRLDLLPLAKRDLCSLFLAADAVVSVPTHDQRSTTILEALATGTRLLLSDIDAYHELAKAGVDVCILEEPIKNALHSAIMSLTRTDAAEFEANRTWCEANENMGERMDEIVALCLGEV